mgnify:FL=1|tara:strand:- start:38166 stop:38531 length:366 start_codon:yes stop_codon:yes gene_type:complete
MELNVLGKPLLLCCKNPITGFFRDGKCRTNFQDFGTHTICAIIDNNFLDYTFKKGNDLITPRPDLKFPGLRSGDKWCLCALRWLEAERQGKAPKVIIESTHIKTLDYIDLKTLLKYSNKVL